MEYQSLQTRWCQTSGGAAMRPIAQLGCITASWLAIQSGAPGHCAWVSSPWGNWLQNPKIPNVCWKGASALPWSDWSFVSKTWTSHFQIWVYPQPLLALGQWFVWLRQSERKVVEYDYTLDFWWAIWASYVGICPHWDLQGYLACISHAKLWNKVCAFDCQFVACCNKSKLGSNGARPAKVDVVARTSAWVVTQWMVPLTTMGPICVT